MKICHLTSVHPRFDTRIFHKECRSLSNAGYETYLVVADDQGNESKEGVIIFDVGSPKGRVDRIQNVTKRVFEKAVTIDAAMYHIHDPELIPAALRLHRRGKKVLFDAHEDVPKQLLNKPYLNQPTRWLLSRLFAFYETRVCGKFDGIVTATPTIRDKYLGIHQNVLDINNFPKLGELTPPTGWTNKSSQVCYIGGIAAVRGIREMVRAMELTKVGARLEIGGKFIEPFVEEEVKTYPGWRNVDELGFLDRSRVRDVLTRSMAGLVTLHPIANYLDALPVKMFEYMSAGIPVISSHFPLWREIIKTNQCGISVDPLKPDEIARAIDYLVENPDQAETMGKNGLVAVQQRYNWAGEEVKLLDLYRTILGRG